MQCNIKNIVWIVNKLLELKNISTLNKTYGVDMQLSNKTN